MMHSLALLALVASVLAQSTSNGQLTNTTLDDSWPTIVYSPAVSTNCVTADIDSFCTGGQWTYRIGPNANSFYNDTVHTACGLGATATFAFQGTQVYVGTTLSGLGTLVNASFDNNTPLQFNTNTTGNSTNYTWAGPVLSNSLHTLVLTVLNPNNTAYACFDLDDFIVTSNSTNPTASQSNSGSGGSASEANSNSGGGGSNAGAIAGGVVGGVVGAALLAFLGWWFWRRRQGKGAPFTGNRDIIDDPEPGDMEEQHRITPFAPAGSVVAPSTAGPHRQGSASEFGETASQYGGSGSTSQFGGSSQYAGAGLPPVVAGGALFNPYSPQHTSSGTGSQGSSPIDANDRVERLPGVASSAPSTASGSDSRPLMPQHQSSGSKGFMPSSPVNRSNTVHPHHVEGSEEAPPPTYAEV